MKTTSSELVNASRLLYKHPYIVIFDKTRDEVVARIRSKNPQIAIAESSCIYDIGAGDFDLKVNYVFEIIFDAENIESYVETPVVVKDVFALGFRSTDEIPASWNVCVLLEFPNGKPAILASLEPGRRFYLSTKKSWCDLMDLYGG